MSAAAVPTHKQYLVTIPGDALGFLSKGVQILVTEWDSGQIEADFRSPADCAVGWRPVELIGGKVERA